MMLNDAEKEAVILLLKESEPEDPTHTALRKLLSNVPAETDELVEFGARIPKSLFDRFRQIAPQYGSVKWFVNSTLEAFVDRVERNPDLLHVVGRSVNDVFTPAS